VSETFLPDEYVRLPLDVLEFGLKQGVVGRVIYIYPRRPYMADVEFPREDGRFVIALLIKDPEVSVEDFYP
jgi:hypothetical protein